jgi:thiamine-phosphate pyrophosphorylase
LKADLSLYVLTDAGLSQGRSHLEVVEAALAGGATAIQFRDKHLATREYLEIGQRLRDLCRQAGATFIVNDRLDLALALQADGVHLGPADLPPYYARRIAPSDFLIGVSVDNVAEALAAVEQGASYLGAGPVFPTRTKLDTGPVMGLDGLAAIVRAVAVPVVGIGSIGRANLAQVISTGAAGAAIISAAVGAVDVRQATAEMRASIDAERARSR